MSKTKRKAISKSVRFEVFKRDKFTCQYCGRSAPEVVLEVDHIKPVSKNGGTFLLNLTTSCIDCNRGKRDRELDDKSRVVVERKQLEVLSEKKEQIEMLIDWKMELMELDGDLERKIEDYWRKKIFDSAELNDKGRLELNQLIKKFGHESVIEGIDFVTSKYLRFENGVATLESVNEAWNKIGGYLFLRNQPEERQKASYLHGIVRNTYQYYNKRVLMIYIKEILSDDIGNYDDLKECIDRSHNWTQLKSNLQDFVEEIRELNEMFN